MLFLKQFYFLCTLKIYKEQKEEYMCEEKEIHATYIIIFCKNNLHQYSLLINHTKEQVIETTKIIEKVIENSCPKIFKIEKEICWKEQKEESCKANKESELHFRYDVFD